MKSRENGFQIRPHALSLKGAAEYLGLEDPQTVRKLIDENRLKAVQIGKRCVRVPISSLEHLLGEDMQ